MIYINKITKARYRWLAQGIYQEKGRVQFRPVAIYCPDDNDHSIAVCPENEFYELFEVGKYENQSLHRRDSEGDEMPQGESGLPVVLFAGQHVYVV